MNDLIKRGLDTIEKLDLNEILIALCSYGRTDIFRHDDDWSAQIEMYVGSIGTKFKIGSGYGHNTPLEAIKELITRIKAALKELNA